MKKNGKVPAERMKGTKARRHNHRVTHRQYDSLQLEAGLSGNEAGERRGPGHGTLCWLKLSGLQATETQSTVAQVKGKLLDGDRSNS